MQKLIWGIIIVLLVGAGAGYALYGTPDNPSQPGNGNGNGEEPARQVLTSAEFGLSVEYPGDPEEYTAVTPETARDGMRVFQRAFYDAQDYAEFENSTDAREAPPAITASVFRQPPNTSVEEWIRSNGDMSHFGQAMSDSIETQTVGGIELATYQYDGLYRADAYAAAGNGYVYLVTVEFADAEADIRSDAEAMLETLSLQEPSLPAQAAHGDIQLTQPQPRATATSPLMVTGEARGPWYFEASFPVVLTDWDGRIIAEGSAEAQGDWMTEAFVPFEAELQFQNPEDAGGDFSRNGSLILQKANPSGLPENDAAIEIPVRFQEPTENEE